MALEGDAAALEKKADEQFTAAQTMKQNTQALSDAYNAARAAAKQTFEDALVKRQEIALMAPDITTATLDITLATSNKAIADKTQAAMAAAQKGNSDAFDDTSDRAKQLRERIDELVKGWTVDGKKQPGLSELVASVGKSGKVIDTTVVDLVTSTDDARKAFLAAQVAATDYRGVVSKMVTEKTIESNDPLAVNTSNAYYTNGLKLLEGIAYSANGETKLVAVAANRVRDDLKADANKALGLAKQSATTVLDPDNTIKPADAVASFTNAISTISSTESGKAPVNWLCLAVRAAAYHGMSIASDVPTDREKYRTSAETAATGARSANPMLEFPGVLDPVAIVAAPIAPVQEAPKIPDVPKVPDTSAAPDGGVAPPKAGDTMPASTTAPADPAAVTPPTN